MRKKEKTSFLTYEKFPDLQIPYKVVQIYLLEILTLIIILFFVWKISSYVWYGALIGQSIITIIAVAPLMYILNKSSTIRRKYKKKYGEMAYQYLFYRFIFITIVPTFVSLYFPILLKTDYFLPKIFSLTENYMTNTIFPVFIALPLFLILLIIGLLIRIPSGGFNTDVESFLYIIYPEKSKMINSGLYRYIRHPRYFGKIFVALSFGIFANNGVGICVSIMHFIPFLLLIKFEDDELSQRFGEKFKEYRHSVPALIPRIYNLGKFLKVVFRLGQVK